MVLWLQNPSAPGKGRKRVKSSTSSYQPIGTKQDAKRPIDTHMVHPKSRGIEST